MCQLFTIYIPNIPTIMIYCYIPNKEIYITSFRWFFATQISQFWGTSFRWPTRSTANSASVQLAEIWWPSTCDPRWQWDSHGKKTWNSVFFSWLLMIFFLVGHYVINHLTHRIHGAGIYANIWGILMVNVTIYSSTMDPSWVMTWIKWLLSLKSHLLMTSSRDFS